MTIRAKFLTWLFPDRIKRMIFLSTLAAHIRDLQQPDAETLSKLNDILLLSSDAKALRFPMEFHSRIWGKFNPVCLRKEGIAVDSICGLQTRGLAKSELRIVANRLIDYMPAWLKYQSKEGIRQDIYKLFFGLELIVDNASSAASKTQQLQAA